MSVKGVVAIVGRPNVGKSTLFNRMTKADAAIVDDRPGVTRDRLYGHVWLDTDKTDGFALIDTGGFETDDDEPQRPTAGQTQNRSKPTADMIWQQTAAAIDESDLVLLLLDAKAGLNPHDQALARYLEKQGKPWLAVVNKVDGPEQQAWAMTFYELGVDQVYAIAAAHSRGFDPLFDAIEEKLASIACHSHKPAPAGAISIAIIGRPNAGKSSILNRLAGEERSLVSELAGTTRDTVDTLVNYNKNSFVLVDTAGIRRRSRVLDRVESLAVMRAIRAIDRADVVFLVLDATLGLSDQDARLAELAVQRMKPLALVVNKWDLVKDKDANSARDYENALHSRLKTMAFAPVIFISCLTNQRVHALLGMAEKLQAESSRRVETNRVNTALRTIVAEHTPALIKGRTRRIKFYFATQVAVSPPTIVVFCNVANELQESYIRYMKNRFRDLLGFAAVPIKIIFRAKDEVRARDSREAERLEAEEEAPA